MAWGELGNEGEGQEGKEGRGKTFEQDEGVGL